MRLRYATLFAAVLSLGWLAPQPGRPDLGLSAKADPDFYTRKRVNGEWITGWFPRTKSAPKAAAAKPVDGRDGKAGHGRDDRVRDRAGRSNHGGIPLCAT